MSAGLMGTAMGIGRGALGQAEDLTIAIETAKENGIEIDKEFYMSVLKVVYGDYTDVVSQVLTFIDAKMEQDKKKGDISDDESKLHGCNCCTAKTE